MVVMKIAYLCLYRLKCSYVIPGMKAFSLSVKTHTRCLHILFYVRISRGTGVAGLDNVLLDSSFSFIQCDGFTLQVYIKHYVKSIVSKGAHKL